MDKDLFTAVACLISVSIYSQGLIKNGWPIYGEIFNGTTCHYTGEIRGLYPHGNGKWVCGDEIQEGRFENGKYIGK